jgi:hypothetical protein
VDTDDLIVMLDTGWSLRDIAAHCNLPIAEVERLIVEQVRAERLEAKRLSQ